MSMKTEQLVLDDGAGEVVIDIGRHDLARIWISIENDDGEVCFFMSRDNWEKFKALGDKYFL